MEFHDATVRVRYAETDQMGVVYHANYLIWFEIGRVELMRALGFEYKLMEAEDDCYIVVAEASCRYLHPARYDELLRVRTRVSQAGNRVVKYAYELLRDSDNAGTRHWSHDSRHLRPRWQTKADPYKISRQVPRFSRPNNEKNMKQ
jgi:YbgC/YbaW family acyl-CoA thioester hydrolase